MIRLRRVLIGTWLLAAASFFLAGSQRPDAPVADPADATWEQAFVDQGADLKHAFVPAGLLPPAPRALVGDGFVRLAVRPPQRHPGRIPRPSASPRAPPAASAA